MTTRLPRALHQTSVHLLGLVVVLVCGVTGAAEAQRVGGSIGVSLTILESVETRPVAVTGFRLQRDGRASIESTAPTAGKVSQIVMTRVSSSADGFQPVEQAPTLLAGDRDRPEAATSERDALRMTHRVDVGRATGGSAAREVQLRIEYLVVAGT